MNLNKIFDYFMFREGTETDDYSTKPIITTGSIVWGVLIRSFIIIFASLFLLEKFYFIYYWWLCVFALWFFVAYPAYSQFQYFSNRMDKFEEETLCGQCKHFSPSSQLCSIYDEHVSRTYIPCEGESWEPK